MTGNLQLEDDDFLPLRDVVYQTLRRAILRNEIQPGERLLESRLAGELGVSRTPVREAIRMLSQEGLVTVYPHRSAVVAGITLSDLEDVLEVRLALESLAVREACRNLTDGQLKDLGRLAAAFERTLEGKDVALCAQADMAFHEAIYNAAGNRRLVQILNNLREQFYRYRIECLKNRSAYLSLSEDHAKILEGLRERREEKALTATIRHINRQKEFIIAELEKKDGG